MLCIFSFFLINETIFFYYLRMIMLFIGIIALILSYSMKKNACPAVKICVEIVASICDEVQALSAPSLRPVINATGVILHTNLGRAVLGSATVSAVHTAASGYTDLEMDIESGSRTSRSRRVTALLRAIAGWEIVISGVVVPMWLSLLTSVFAGGLAVGLWREASGAQ